MKKAVKAKKTKKAKTKRSKVEVSKGNVFADLGFKDSEERLLKAKLAAKVAQLIGERTKIFS